MAKDGSASRDWTGTRSSPPVLLDFRPPGPGQPLPWCPRAWRRWWLRLPLLKVWNIPNSIWFSQIPCGGRPGGDWSMDTWEIWSCRAFEITQGHTWTSRSQGPAFLLHHEGLTAQEIWDMYCYAAWKSKILLCWEILKYRGGDVGLHPQILCSSCFHKRRTSQVKKREASYTLGGSVKWGSLWGKQCGSSLKN